METTTDINFSYNWNNKLNCNCFTTLRIKNDKKYIIGKSYNILLKKEFLKTVEIVDIKYLNISNINDYIGYLDTGYSAIETIAILKKMYPKIDFYNTALSFILMKTIK